MKKLCHSTEMLVSSREEYISLVKDGKFMCSKCGRIAVHEENLCRPVSIDNISTKNTDLEETINNRDMDIVGNNNKSEEFEEIMTLDEAIIVEERKNHGSHHKHKKKIKIIKKERLIKLIHKEARKEIEHYKEQEHQI